MPRRRCDLARWSELLVFFTGRDALHAYVDASRREAVAIFDRLDDMLETNGPQGPLLRDPLHSLRGIAATLGFISFNRELEDAARALANDDCAAARLRVTALRCAFLTDITELHAWRSGRPPDCDCGSA